MNPDGHDDIEWRPLVWWHPLYWVGFRWYQFLDYRGGAESRYQTNGQRARAILEKTYGG